MPSEELECAKSPTGFHVPLEELHYRDQFVRPPDGPQPDGAVLRCAHCGVVCEYPVRDDTYQPWLGGF